MPAPDSPTPAEAVQAALSRIECVDAAVGAFVQVFGDRVGGEAASLPAGTGDLHGVPVAVKELFDLRGAECAAGSSVLAGRRPSEDSAVVERLRAAGALIVGTTRSHEFAWGITTQHVERGSTRNPHDLSRVPGGSSGGSAAAVAAGMVPLAIGTDTGGSIRIPAAFCGVLGLKTTPGRISRRGSVALAPSFDTPGLLASSVELLARGLAALAGADPGDPRTLVAPGLARPELPRAPRAARFSFAVPEELQPAPLAPVRRAALDRVAAALAAAGGTAVAVSIPGVETAGELFLPQIMAEASFVHRRVLGAWPSRADDYGRDVAARLRYAERVTFDDYLAARAGSEVLRTAFATAFGTADVLVNVVGVCGPSTVADPDRVVVGGATMSLLDATMPSTLPQNIAGLPSLTLPVGDDDDGLPIGVQLSGPPWSESLLLAIGGRLEAAGAVQFRRAQPAP